MKFLLKKIMKPEYKYKWFKNIDDVVLHMNAYKVNVVSIVYNASIGKYVLIYK